MSFFSVFPFFGRGRVISTNLGYKGGCPQSISYEERGHHILQELPAESQIPPAPLPPAIKNERSVKTIMRKCDNENVTEKNWFIFCKKHLQNLTGKRRKILRERGTIRGAWEQCLYQFYFEWSVRCLILHQSPWFFIWQVSAVIYRLKVLAAFRNVPSVFCSLKFSHGYIFFFVFTLKSSCSCHCQMTKTALNSYFRFV